MEVKGTLFAARAHTASAKNPCAWAMVLDNDYRYKDKTTDCTSVEVVILYYWLELFIQASAEVGHDFWIMTTDTRTKLRTRRTQPRHTLLLVTGYGFSIMTIWIRRQNYGLHGRKSGHTLLPVISYYP